MPLISLAEATARCQEALPPITRTEEIAVKDACGRVLATEIVAPLNVPSFARATMDGYAVRSAETAAATPASPARLRCIGFAAAGQPVRRAVGPGECVEIATGGMLPDGADAVVMVEATKRVEAEVVVFQPVRPDDHIAARGSDMAQGARLFGPGTVITPARLATVAGLGFTTVTVYGRPRVAVLASGTELREPGEPLGPGQIYNMNAPALAAQIAAHGGAAITTPLVADDEGAILQAMAHAAGDRCDLLLFSGGSSVGRKDLLTQLASREGQVVFHGIALKPGRPTLLARMAGAIVLGLPGNPTSCLVVAELLVVPVLRRLAHLPPRDPTIRSVRLGQALVSPAGLHHVVTVRIEAGVAWPVFKESGDITSLSMADGYLEVPVGVVRLEAGAPVDVTAL